MNSSINNSFKERLSNIDSFILKYNISVSSASLTLFKRNMLFLIEEGHIPTIIKRVYGEVFLDKSSSNSIFLCICFANQIIRILKEYHKDIPGMGKSNLQAAVMHIIGFDIPTLLNTPSVFGGTKKLSGTWFDSNMERLIALRQVARKNNIQL